MSRESSVHRQRARRIEEFAVISQSRRIRLSSVFSVLLLLAALVSAGCGDGGAVEPPEPPRPVDRAHLDPAVAEAIDNALAEVEADPENLDNWTRLAMVYHANELFEPARNCYEFLAAADPENPRLWYYVALLRYRLDDDDGAFAAISRVIGLDGSYAPARSRLGDWLLDRGEPRQAGKEFRRAIELDPIDPAGHVGMARVRMESDDPAAAAEILEERLALGSEDPYVHLLLGNAYRQLGRMEEAQVELRQGQTERNVRRDPWAAEVMRFRTGFSAAVGTASDLLFRGENQLAVQMFEKLTLEKPDDLRVLTKLGIGYLRLGRTAEALVVLREAERLYPDHHKVHLQLASALQLSGDSQGALEQIDRAIELKPELALSHARRGTILKQAGRLREAAESFRQALLHGPGDPRLLTELGDCHGALKEWPQAAAAYAEALQSETGSAELYTRFGIASFASENFDDAVGAFERATQLGPKHPEETARWLSQARLRLQQQGGAG